MALPKITIPKIKATFGQGSALTIILVDITVLVYTRKDCPPDLRQALLTLLALCAGYLWGSSAGSHAKDATIANSTPVAANTSTDTAS